MKPWAAAWSITVPQDNPLSEFFNREQDIVKKYIPQAILATPADFDKTYDEMLAQLTRQTGTYFPMETELVMDRLRLWGTLKWWGQAADWSGRRCTPASLPARRLTRSPP